MLSSSVVLHYFATVESTCQSGKNTSLLCAPLQHAYSYTTIGMASFFLPGAFLLISCSEFGVTAHDDTHNAFVTLLPYTYTREGEARQLTNNPKPCL